MRRIELNEDHAKTIMTLGGIPAEISGASPRTAVILTQGWCPQWHAMNNYLQRMEEEAAAETEELSVFYLVYDQIVFAEEFIQFKETRFSNDQIPFVLYYRGGQLKETTNYVSESTFLELF